MRCISGFGVPIKVSISWSSHEADCSKYQLHIPETSTVSNIKEFCEEAEE